MKKRILMLTSRSPYPLTAGYRLRIHYLAKLLSETYDVDLVSLQKVEPISNSPFKNIFTFPIPSTQLVIQSLKNYHGGWPLQVSCYFNNDGKPVVATSLPVQGIKAGIPAQYFIVADTPEQMQKEITDLLNDRKKRREIGREARRLIKQQYTWNHIGEDLSKILKTLL